MKWVDPYGTQMLDSKRVHFCRLCHSFNRRMKINLSFDIYSISHIVIFIHSSFACMIPIHIHIIHRADLLVTGYVSHSVKSTHEYSSIVWVLLSRVDVRSDTNNKLIEERYMGVSKSQLWVAPGSRTSVSLQLCDSESDVLPVHALGFRGVRYCRRVRHPWFPAPGCVEPPACSRHIIRWGVNK